MADFHRPPRTEDHKSSNGKGGHPLDERENESESTPEEPIKDTPSSSIEEPPLPQEPSLPQEPPQSQESSLPQAPPQSQEPPLSQEPPQSQEAPLSQEPLQSQEPQPPQEPPCSEAPDLQAPCDEEPEDAWGEAARQLMKSFGLFRKRPWEQMSLGGYTAGEIKVLMTLKFHAAMKETDSLKVSEISSRMGVTSPTITQFINGLEAKGLVTRIMDPQDRRAVRVELTEEGQQIADQAHEAFRAHFKGLVHYLGREESAELARLLTKVYTYWTEHEAAPPPPGSEAKGEE